MPAHNGVRTASYPCRGSQIPWSQMISMNISPPRLIPERRVDTLPAVNARIRNSDSRNIGSGTRFSINTNSPTSARPLASIKRTKGLLQPIDWPPCGWIP